MNIEQNLNIEKIPSGWSIQRVKEVAFWQTGFTPDTKKSEYYDGNDEWITIRDLDGKHVKTSKNKINGNFFPKEWITPANSLLFSFKLSIGQVAFNEKEVYTNEAICSFSPKLKISLNYFYYAAPYFIVKNAKKNIYGADLLNQELIANAILMIPPKIKQVAIANYLDTETSKIDRKILILEQKFDKLEDYKQSVIFETVTKGLDSNVAMKDSSIDWIGDIPAHWKVKRVKDIFTLKKGKNAGLYSADFIHDSENKGNFPVYSGQTENNGIMGSIKTYEYNYSQGVLFTTTVGAKAMTVKRLFNEFSLSQNCGLLIPTKPINLDYSYYLITACFSFVKQSIPFHMQPSLRKEDLGSFYCLDIPVKEQEKIVSYLNEIVSKLDYKKSIIKKQIKLLQEYKESIIFECVTGKMEIL